MSNFEKPSQLAASSTKNHIGNAVEDVITQFGIGHALYGVCNMVFDAWASTAIANPPQAEHVSEIMQDIWKRVNAITLIMTDPDLSDDERISKALALKGVSPDNASYLELATDVKRAIVINRIMAGHTKLADELPESVRDDIPPEILNLIGKAVEGEAPNILDLTDAIPKEKAPRWPLLPDSE